LVVFYNYCTIFDYLLNNPKILKTRLLFCFLLFTLCFGVKKAIAATFTWTGGGGTNTNWYLPANWGTTFTYPGSVFGQPDAVIIPAGFTIVVTNPTVFFGSISSITFNASSGTTSTLTLDQALNVSGAVTVGNDGAIFDGGGLLTAASFSTSGPIHLNTPLTITTGDTYISNNTSVTTGALGVINGITFTTTGNSAVSFGASATFTGLMTFAESAGLTSATSSTITAGSVTLSGQNTVNLSSPIIVSGLMSQTQGTFTCSSAATISAGNFTMTNGNTLTTGASVTVNSGGTLSVSSSNITTNTSSATITTPNFTSAASSTNTYSLLGAVNVTTLLTITSGNSVFSSTTPPLVTAAAVQISGATLTLDVPLTVTGAITTASGSVITSNSSGVINTATMSLTGTTFNLSATSTTSGNVSFISGTSTLNGTPLFSANSVNLTSGAITLHEPLTSTNALTVASGTSITGNSIGVLIAGSMSITGATISLAAAASTTSSDITFVSGTNAFTNTASTSSAANINLQAGTLTFISTGSTSIVTSTNLFETANASTLNASISALAANALQIAGTYNINSSGTITTASTSIASNYITKGITFVTGSTTVTFLGAGNVGVSGTTNFVYATNVQVGSSTVSTTTLTFNAGASITNTGGSATIANYANLVLAGTSSSGITVNLPNSQIIYNYSTGTATAAYTTFTFGAGTSGFNNAGKFTVNSGSIININGYGGDITNSGTFIAGSPSGSPCTINLNAGGGTGSSSSIYNSNIFILGSTSVINFGTAYGTTVDNAGTFTLMSDASGSAAISSIGTSNGQSMTGTKYNVQRFITGGSVVANRGYRMLSAPVNYSTTAVPTSAISNPISLATLSSTYTVNSLPYNGIYTAAPSPATGLAGINAYGSTLYLYNEIRPNSNTSYSAGKNEGIYTITTTGGTYYNGTSTATFTLPTGNGFLAYFAGSPTTWSATAGPIDCTITNVGYINQGTIPVYLWYTPNTGNTTPIAGTAGNLSYTATLTTALGGAGFNMLGNPYPCSIYLPTVLSDNTSSNFNGAWVLERGSTQSYIATTTAGSSSPNGGYVASGEGFLVQVKTGGVAFKFYEDEKVPTTQLTGTGSSMAYRPSLKPTIDAAATNPNTLTGLYMKLVRDSVTYDYCGIYYGKQWSSSSGDDAIDLDQSDAAAYMSSLTSDGIAVSVNHMPDYTPGSRVKLFVNAATDGLYHLNIEDIRNIDTALYSIFLIDNNKKDSLDIGLYRSYAFNIAKADTATFGGNRFVLAIEQKPLPPYRLITFAGQKVSAGVQLNWRTSNEGNYTGFGLQKLNLSKQYTTIDSAQSNSGGTYNYIDQNPVKGNNIYRLEQNDINGKVTYSSVIIVNYNYLTSGGVFTVYPNPAKEFVTFSLTTSTTMASSYSAKIYNSAGALMGSKSINTNTWTEDVTSYKPGTYIILLQSEAGDMVGQSKFVKTN